MKKLALAAFAVVLFAGSADMMACGKDKSKCSTSAKKECCSTKDKKECSTDKAEAKKDDKASTGTATPKAEKK